MSTERTGFTMTEFQTLLRLVPVLQGDDHRGLEELAERAVVALQNVEAGRLALGVVASVDLDQGAVELEMTIEASSDSELHQKMGLILAALERGVPLRLCQSTASRVVALDGEPELVCA